MSFIIIVFCLGMGMYIDLVCLYLWNGMFIVIGCVGVVILYFVDGDVYLVFCIIVEFFCFEQDNMLVVNM